MPRTRPPEFLFSLDLPRRKRAAVFLASRSDLNGDDGWCDKVLRRKEGYNFFISLARGMSRSQMRETLIHELDHALHWEKKEHAVAADSAATAEALELLFAFWPRRRRRSC